MFNSVKFIDFIIQEQLYNSIYYKIALWNCKM